MLLLFCVTFVLDLTPADDTAASQSKSRKSRITLSREMHEFLTKHFISCQYPNYSEQQVLARVTGLSEYKIQAWFQNRRTRMRRKMRVESKLVAYEKAETPVHYSPLTSHKCTEHTGSLYLPSLCNTGGLDVYDAASRLGALVASGAMTSRSHAEGSHWSQGRPMCRKRKFEEVDQVGSRDESGFDLVSLKRTRVEATSPGYVQSAIQCPDYSSYWRRQLMG